MKPFILITALVCAFIQQTHAQSELQIQVGANYSNLKDRHFSPLNYSHGGLNFGLTYSRISPSKKSRFYTHIQFLTQDLEHSRFDYLTSNFISGSLDIGYQKRVKHSEKLSWYLGGGFQSVVNYIDFEDQESFSFLMAHSFNLGSYIEYNLSEKSILGGSIEIPLVSLLVRPPYNGIDEELDKNTERPLHLITNGDVVSLDSYRSVQTSVFYRQQLSEKLGIKTTYALVYQQAKADTPFIRFQNQITVGFIYTF